MEELISQYKISLDAVHNFKKVLLNMQEHIAEHVRDFNTLMKLMEEEIKIMENNSKEVDDGGTNSSS